MNAQELAVVAAGLSAFAALAAAYATYRGPLSAAKLAAELQLEEVERARKMDLLRRVAGARRSNPTPEFTGALNEIVIVFNESSDVINALHQFYRATTGEGGHNERLTALVKAMMDDLALSTQNLPPEFMLRPFEA